MIEGSGGLKIDWNKGLGLPECESWNWFQSNFWTRFQRKSAKYDRCTHNTISMMSTHQRASFTIGILFCTGGCDSEMWAFLCFDDFLGTWLLTLSARVFRCLIYTHVLRRCQLIFYHVGSHNLYYNWTVLLQRNPETQFLRQSQIICPIVLHRSYPLSLCVLIPSMLCNPSIKHSVDCVYTQRQGVGHITGQSKIRDIRIALWGGFSNILIQTRTQPHLRAPSCRDGSIFAIVSTCRLSFHNTIWWALQSMQQIKHFKYLILTTIVGLSVCHWS
jgi:hypothetical protein